jgi:hypothetical protein
LGGTVTQPGGLTEEISASDQLDIYSEEESGIDNLSCVDARD